MQTNCINYNGETEEAYLWKLGQAKDKGIIDLDWSEIADIMNKQFRKDDTEYRTEAAYRKPYQQAKRFYESGVFSKFSEDEYLTELKELKDSLFKEKRKFFDQRREYNKILTTEARTEHLNECLIESLNRIQEQRPLDFRSVQENNNFLYNVSDKEGVLVLSDWHFGMVTDNIWNKFDTQICRERVEKTIYFAKKYIELNKISKLHIVILGDLVHGGIHISCRVASEETVCNQLMKATEMVAESIAELSTIENLYQIKVYSTYGNHARTIQNKSDSVHSDNMETIVPWYLKARLEGCNKVSVIDSPYKEFIKFNVCGYNVVAVHGDLDKFKDLGTTVNMIFSKKEGETIDYTISGDKHHLEEFERFGVESILVRSLCGTDDYANGMRLYSKAGQTFMVFNGEYGRESTYNIPLD